MCTPAILAFLGTGAAATGVGTSAAVAATSGLFGSGGVFSLGATMTTLGTIGAVGGLGMAAQQNIANLEYQTSMANYNVKVAENNALASEFAAQHEAEVFEDRFRRLQASQGPKYAAAGVLINQDTPLAVDIDTAKQGALEKLAILYSGKVRSGAARQAAIGQKYAAVNYASMVRPTATAGALGAGTSLLSGLGARFG